MQLGNPNPVANSTDTQNLLPPPQNPTDAPPPPPPPHNPHNQPLNAFLIQTGCWIS